MRRWPVSRFVQNGPDTKWVIVVGLVQDCDAAPAAPGAPPTVTVTPPTNVTEGDTVSLAVQATDPDGDLAKMRVDWGDGSTGSTTHRYRDDGTFALTVRVRDGQGEHGDRRTLRRDGRRRGRRDSPCRCRRWWRDRQPHSI